MTFTAIIDFTVGLMLVGAMLLMLVRLFIGPTLYDRVLAVNAFGAKIVLFLAVFALAVGRADSLDIALLYALINFVATIAILKFFSYRSLEVALDDMKPARPRDDAGEGV
ncbi:MAG: cation:proton antiporter [Oceanicaulis sp.]|nr:cation:proton antiporter [Oceanicaulis sp.]